MSRHREPDPDETPRDRVAERDAAEEAPPADEAGEADEEGAAAEATSDDLEEARRECQELMARLQRTAADYQNFQKRMARRLEEAARFARRDVVQDLLPVIDNFERAIEAARDEPDMATFLEGVQLVHDQLLGALEKHGARQIEAAGEPFDPELHDAVGRMPHEECPEGHVAEVLQKGYLLGDQTLRPSRVIVSAGPDEGA